MGYYVRSFTDENNFKVRKENFDNAYKAMVALNENDDLKRGGSYGPNGMTEKWFSWMDPNYPDSCPDFQSVMGALGFVTEYDANGDLVKLEYDNKMGQEDVFLQAIAPYVESGSHMVWHGEDGMVWVQIFKNGQIDVHEFDIDRIISSKISELLKTQV